MSTNATGDYNCRHGIDIALCALCSPPKAPVWQMQHPAVAGHCGKCGAPYTTDLQAGLCIGPPKFIPSCRCWNTV